MLPRIRLLIIFNALLITTSAIEKTSKTPLDDIALFYVSQLNQPEGEQLQDILTKCLLGVLTTRLCNVGGVQALAVTAIKGIKENCDNCNEYQKKVFEDLYTFYTQNKKEDWERIVSKYQYHEGAKYVDEILGDFILKKRFINCLLMLDYGGLCNSDKMSYVIRTTIAGVRDNCAGCNEDQKKTYRKLFLDLSTNKKLWEHILQEFNSQN